MEDFDDDLDVELFIDEVKLHPALWDTAVEDYHDKFKKRSAWTEVFRKFIPRYQDLDDRDRAEFGRKLTKKWKNLKDNYARNVRKQRKFKKSRKYIYAKQLAFLNLTGERSVTATSGIKIENDTEEDDNQTFTFTLPGEDASSTSSYYKSNENALTCIPSSSLSSLQVSPQRKKLMEETMIKFMNGSETYVEPDEDRSFFESLLPALKQFDTDQKLEFRSEVLNLIRRIRSHMPNYPF